MGDKDPQKPHRYSQGKCGVGASAEGSPARPSAWPCPAGGEPGLRVGTRASPPTLPGTVCFPVGTL